MRPRARGLHARRTRGRAARASVGFRVWLEEAAGHSGRESSSPELTAGQTAQPARAGGATEGLLVWDGGFCLRRRWGRPRCRPGPARRRMRAEVRMAVISFRPARICPPRLCSSGRSGTHRLHSLASGQGPGCPQRADTSWNVLGTHQVQGQGSAGGVEPGTDTCRTHRMWLGGAAGLPGEGRAAGAPGAQVCEGRVQLAHTSLNGAADEGRKLALGEGGRAPPAAVSHPGPLTATYTPWTGLHLGTLPEASQPQSSMEVTVVVPQAGSRKEWHLVYSRRRCGRTDRRHRSRVEKAGSCHRAARRTLPHAGYKPAQPPRPLLTERSGSARPGLRSRSADRDPPPASVELVSHIYRGSHVSYVFKPEGNSILSNTAHGRGSPCSGTLRLLNPRPPSPEAAAPTRRRHPPGKHAVTGP